MKKLLDQIPASTLENLGGFMAVFPYIWFFLFSMVFGMNKEGIYCFYDGEYVGQYNNRSFWRCDPFPVWSGLTVIVPWIFSIIFTTPLIVYLHDRYNRRA